MNGQNIDYNSFAETEPLERGDYLCRLLDNRNRPFYKVLTWYGVAFWDGMVQHKNITHWAEVPVMEGDDGATEFRP